VRVGGGHVRTAAMGPMLPGGGGEPASGVRQISPGKSWRAVAMPAIEMSGARIRESASRRCAAARTGRRPRCTCHYDPDRDKALRDVGFLPPLAQSSEAVEKRLSGFCIQSTACLLLFISAAAGVVMQIPRLKAGLPNSACSKPAGNVS
jgi:hypothetical protein